MGKQCRLNQDLVFRESDKALFDVKKFKIYKFNEKGYALLSLLGGIKDVIEWKQRATSKKLVTEEEFDRFVQKCEKNSIIVIDRDKYFA